MIERQRAPSNARAVRRPHFTPVADTIGPEQVHFAKLRHGSLALLLLFGGALHAQSGQRPLRDEGTRAEEAALEKAADTIFAGESRPYSSAVTVLDRRGTSRFPKTF